ncbi:MAG: POTRA domain-containing protein, partial [Verrucomicrobiota bacterium]
MLHCGIGLIAIALLGQQALAQDEDRAEELKQNVLEELGLDALVSEELSPETSTDEGGQEVILPALKGLVLLPRQEQVNQFPGESGKVSVGIDGAPDNLEGELQGFLDQPLTLNLLAQVNRTINRVYREDDRPVVDAYLPEQDVSSGVVQLIVTEGLLGTIRVEGAERSNPDYLTRQIRTQPGESIRQSELGWDLDWLNDHPFRRVKMIFEPGETEGTTDIVLQTTDEKPLRLHTGIDNTGLDLTGENQWDFGITWGRVFNTEQIAAYQYTTDVEFESLEAHSLFYRIPLPWRHRIDLVGAYVTSSAEVLSGDELIGVGGESTLAGAEYVIPIRPRFFDLSRSELSFGADYKTTNSDLEFGGLSVFDETASILQFGMGWQGARP